MNKKLIPNTIKEYRHRANLRQIDLALALGFKSDDRISRWEKGLAYPSVPNLIKISKILRVPVEVIYYNID